MTTVNIHHAKTHLSKLLARVEAGEEIIIARAGRPIARLTPLAPVQKRRTAGTWAGAIHMSDDFDESMPVQWLEPLEP